MQGRGIDGTVFDAIENGNQPRQVATSATRRPATVVVKYPPLAFRRPSAGRCCSILTIPQIIFVLLLPRRMFIVFSRYFRISMPPADSASQTSGSDCASLSKSLFYLYDDPLPSTARCAIRRMNEEVDFIRRSVPTIWMIEAHLFCAVKHIILSGR